MAITAILAKLAAIYSNLSKVDNKTYGLKNGEFFEAPVDFSQAIVFNGDVNTLTDNTNRLYVFSNVATNTPIAGEWFYGIKQGGNILATQIWAGTPRLWLRSLDLDGVTWSAWIKTANDDGVTSVNICDLAMDGTTLINSIVPWYYKSEAGLAKLITHYKSDATSLGYIATGTGNAMAVANSGSGSSCTTSLAELVVSPGTTATGYATVSGGVEFAAADAAANFYNKAQGISGVGSRIAASASMHISAVSDATNTYTAVLTLLGKGPLTNAAILATSSGFMLSYTHSVNSGNYVINYRGSDGTLKTINTSVAPGVGVANSKRIVAKAYRSAAGTATVTINIAGTEYTIIDSSFNTDSTYTMATIGVRVLKSVGTTARTVGIRHAAVARNFA